MSMRSAASNLSFRQLRAFVAVADETSMTRAATKLSLTPSALSMLIRSMEEDLGVRLFERTTRKLILTESGERLLPVVREVFQRLDEGIQSVLRSQQVRESTLTLATSPLMAASYVPKVMAGFRQLQPAVKIRLVDAPVESLPSLVRQGEVDLAICTATEDTADLHAEQLYVDRLMLVCHPDHPMAERSECAGRTWSASRSFSCSRAVACAHSPTEPLPSGPRPSPPPTRSRTSPRRLAWSRQARASRCYRPTRSLAPNPPCTTPTCSPSPSSRPW